MDGKGSRRERKLVTLQSVENREYRALWRRYDNYWDVTHSQLQKLLLTKLKMSFAGRQSVVQREDDYNYINDLLYANVKFASYELLL